MTQSQSCPQPVQPTFAKVVPVKQCPTSSAPTAQEVLSKLMSKASPVVAAQPMQPRVALSAFKQVQAPSVVLPRAHAAGDDVKSVSV